ncbi:hypothetical protein AVEN_179862-1 [Araneus ventricosus]|uniref:Tc1-like transposase DDE domain-containing protein n=1 Tax=Araneus ventricosus TaxID=182803 RepID=A0A4Y2IHE7_ARAVE|nr:hypothetical protein AVEN_179862-1 [Araneus ventricosus]
MWRKCHTIATELVGNIQKPTSAVQRNPGALHWPSYSPDLNPYDFFLWGRMKQLVYNKPTDIISLKRFITDSFASIKRKALELVTANFVVRLCYCIISDGSHFENIQN